jgi:ABC-type nitrate/sulfonate/bicarbonate transport system permease component
MRRVFGSGTRFVPKRTVILPAIGLVSLLIIWEVGSFVMSETSENSTIRWPSIQYIVTESLPGIGTVGVESVGASTEPGTAFGAGGIGAEEGGSYSRAFDVLLEEAWITVKRVLVGATIGVVLGLVLGFAISLSRTGRRLLYPVVNLVRQFPLLALSYVFLIWFGGAPRGIYVFIVFGVATLVVVSTINAVRNVPSVQIRFAQSLGATRLTIARNVVLPATVPELIPGIQVAVGLAWPMVLAGEYLGAQAGLGRLMLSFETFQFTGRMMVILWLFVIFALITYLLLAAIGNYLTRWAPRVATAG